MNLINIIIYISIFIIIYNLPYIFYINEISSIHNNNINLEPTHVNNNNINLEPSPVNNNNINLEPPSVITQVFNNNNKYIKKILNYYSKKIYCILFNKFDNKACSDNKYLNGNLPKKILQ